MADLLVSLFPTAIAKLLMRAECVPDDLEVDLRSNRGFVLSLGSAIPEVDIWLRITNKNPINVTVDRILYDVWMGGPVVDGTLLHRYELSARQTLQDIRLHSKLSSLQRDAIKQYLGPTSMNRSATIHLHVLYGASKLGAFGKTVTKELYDLSRLEG